MARRPDNRPNRPARRPKASVSESSLGSGVASNLTGAGGTGMARARRHAPMLPRIGVVVSRYNDSVTSHLLEGALGELERAGYARGAIVVLDAPGSYEVVALASACARSGRFEGVVALGCIIRGETIHDRVLADAVTQGLTNITIMTGVPIGLGVLTVETVDQAFARAGGDKGNKGAEAVGAVLGTLASLQRLAMAGRDAGGFGGGSGMVRPDKARSREDRSEDRRRRARREGGEGGGGRRA